MSITPTQMSLPVVDSAGPAPAARYPKAPTPIRAPSEAPGEYLAPATAVTSPPKLSTNMRVDDQKRVYYEVVNDRTGDVVCEIPPEVIRKLGENLDSSLVAKPVRHSVDVKS